MLLSMPLPTTYLTSHLVSIPTLIYQLIVHNAHPNSQSLRSHPTTLHGDASRHDEEDGRWLREEEGQLRQMLGYQMDGLLRTILILCYHMPKVSGSTDYPHTIMLSHA